MFTFYFIDNFSDNFQLKNSFLQNYDVTKRKHRESFLRSVHNPLHENEQKKGKKFNGDYCLTSILLFILSRNYHYPSYIWIFLKVSKNYKLLNIFELYWLSNYKKDSPGWMDGWMDVKVGLWIVYSYLKIFSTFHPLVVDIEKEKIAIS